MRRLAPHKALTFGAWLAAALLSAAVCPGCHLPSFSRESYDTIYVHQPEEEVRKIMGPPDRSGPDHWDYVNRRPSHYEARIWFERGMVTKKEWFERKELFKDEEWGWFRGVARRFPCLLHGPSGSVFRVRENRPGAAGGFASRCPDPDARDSPAGQSRHRGVNLGCRSDGDLVWGGRAVGALGRQG
jgi:hypothetical protein